MIVEEREILEKKEKLDAAQGVVEGEVSPIDMGSGVYPKSYFDLNKYTTHWKLVGIVEMWREWLGERSVEGQRRLDRSDGRELQDPRSELPEGPQEDHVGGVRVQDALL